MKKSLSIGWVILMTLPTFLMADDAQLSQMAKDLVDKRSKVDEISTELEIKKSEINSLQASTEVQKTDLQRLIKAEETRMGKFDQDIDKLEKKLRTQEVPTEQIQPILMRALQQLETYIEKGLPFQKDARLAEVRNLRDLINSGTLIPEKGLSKVWSMLESEFRLTRENGLYRQNIERDGMVHLADVVKVGMSKMYFKIDEKQLGQVVQKGSEVEYLYADNKEDKDRLNVLFEDFQKKIRTGFFVLPKI